MKKKHTDIDFLPNKQLIVSLIKDDLKNSKLVAGLEELGLDSSKYYLDLGETILSLMGFKDEEKNEELWEEYSDSLSVVSEINIFEAPQKLDFLAVAIYLKLEKIRSRLD